MTTLTPYLSKETEPAIRLSFQNHHPAFLRVVDLPDTFTPDYCRNCAGLGTNVVQFTKSGPAKTPPATTAPIVWFDGDGMAGKGWYIIERTVEFTCPHCNGEGRKEVEQPKTDYGYEKSRSEWTERKLHKPQALDRELKRIKVTA